MNVTLRRTIAAAAVLLTAPALSACGFNEPTDQIYTPAVGVNERGGSVDVLNAVIVSGADGSGTLVTSLVNNDPENDDALVEVVGSGNDGNITVQGGSIDIPAGELVRVAEEGDITFEGEQVQAGFFVELTFRFEQAESVTLKAPVVEREGPYAEIPVPSVAPETEAPEEDTAAH